MNKERNSSLSNLYAAEPPNGLRSRTSPAGCGAGVGVDSAWEQEKLKARKMLENAQTPTSRVHTVLGASFAILPHEQINSF